MQPGKKSEIKILHISLIFIILSFFQLYSQDWETEANQSIENIRKRNIMVNISDEYGNPIGPAVPNVYAEGPDILLCY